jgi:response regulator RpfG family c-di-GMP phosphodiesterase
MPEQNGAEVLTEIRAEEEYRDIPVIFLTGVSEKDTVIKLISEFKPQGYIVKPSKKSEIVAKIIDVLG